MTIREIHQTLPCEGLASTVRNGPEYTRISPPNAPDGFSQSSVHQLDMDPLSLQCIGPGRDETLETGLIEIGTRGNVIHDRLDME